MNKLILLATLLIWTATGHVSAQTAEDGVKLALEGKFPEAMAVWEAIGDAISLRNIGGVYISGVLGSQNLEAARDYLERAANMNDAQAMLSLGYIHLNGAGTPADLATAKGWFVRASDLGLPEAKYMVSQLILDRPNSESDVLHAIELLQASANAGFPKSLVKVGDLLRSGTYTEQDVNKALSYYQAAADNGVAEALNTIGDIYLFAELGEADTGKALTAYNRAIEKGVKASMYSAAFLLYSSPDANQNTLSRAYDLAKTAALAWDEQAQLLLGRMYIEGRYISRNMEEAFFWLDLAASAGVFEAHHLRALAATELGSKAVEKLHARARMWFDENHSTPHTHRLLTNNQHRFQ